MPTEMPGELPGTKITLRLFSGGAFKSVRQNITYSHDPLRSHPVPLVAKYLAPLISQ